jgi:hypothetical protein
MADRSISHSSEIWLEAADGRSERSPDKPSDRAFAQG